jgi:hypothetical protein
MWKIINNQEIFMSIKIENVQIVGMSRAIDFRRSFNSQHKSDSAMYFETTKFSSDKEGYHTVEQVNLGPNDLKRLENLVIHGDSHAKVNRMILVFHDLTLPRRVWVDYDTYRIGRKDAIYPDDIEYMSDSTMHTIHRGFVDRTDFSEHTDIRIISLVNEKISYYKVLEYDNASKDALDIAFLEIKEAMGEGYLQTRTVMINYQALRHIRLDRPNHRQPELPFYCDWIDSLPYANTLIAKVA